METEQFDVLTRRLSSAGPSRRQALRALGSLFLGGALGGVAAKFGFDSDAAAKGQKHGKRHGDRKRQSQLHTAGKGHKKHKNKHHDKRKDPSPPPQPSCGDGTVRCPDGLCAPADMCCTDGKRCVDPETSSGYSCLGLNDCCPDQKKCAGGCINADACCPEDPFPLCGRCDDVRCSHGKYKCITKCCSDEKPCPGGACVAKNACCPGETRCDDGSCIPDSECCPDEYQCPDGLCVGTGQCCIGEKRCGDTCIAESECCPEQSQPDCAPCEEMVCFAGEYVCNPGPTCQSECPENSVVCPGAPGFWYPREGGSIWFPAGCCPEWKYVASEDFCAQPWSGGGAWGCNP